MNELIEYAGCDALLNANNETKITLIKHCISTSTMGINDWARAWDNLIQSINRKLSAVKR